MKKALKFKADIEIWQRQNCIKLKVLGQLGVHLKEIKSYRTKLNFVQITKIRQSNIVLKIKKKKTDQTTIVHQLFLFTQKSCWDSYFSGGFNASSLHSI
jgi:hypothetical protein